MRANRPADQTTLSWNHPLRRVLNTTWASRCWGERRWKVGEKQSDGKLFLLNKNHLEMGEKKKKKMHGGRRELERERAGPVPMQTGGAAGAAHHLCSSDRKQERAKVSQLANGSESDPPIRTEDDKRGGEASYCVLFTHHCKVHYSHKLFRFSHWSNFESRHTHTQSCISK